MTDVEVEKLLIDRFLNNAGSMLDTEVIGGKTVYKNVNRENISFTRPDDLYWFNVWFIPSRPKELVSFKSSGELWRGILQIDICTPNNIGKDALNERYKKVYECFPRGYIKDENGLSVRITAVGRSVLQTFDDYSSLSVSVAWEAYLK